MLFPPAILFLPQFKEDVWERKDEEKQDCDYEICGKKQPADQVYDEESVKDARRWRKTTKFFNFHIIIHFNLI